MIKYLLLIVSITCFLSINSFAQFQDAQLPQYSSGITPMMPLNTGNDIMDFGGQTYEVSVCDDQVGNNSILTWKVGSNIGFTFIGQGAQVLDPDVCLVKNGAGSVFAIVAFFDVNTTQFMMQVFNWNVSQQQFNSLSNVAISSGDYNSSINIDSDDNGTFAIVWDQPGNSIFMAFGLASGGAAPQLSLGGAVLNLEQGSEPDVCIYRKGSTNYRQVNVAYVVPSGEIFIDAYPLANLLVGNNSFIPLHRTPSPDLEYRSPRIACPGSSFGTEFDFTLVAEDTDGNSTWYIKVFNYNLLNGSQLSNYIYNDGSTGNSPFNITDVPNTKPVVCYDDQAESIWVAWNFDNSWGLSSAPSAPIATFPVAMSVNRDGDIFTLSKYLSVPLGVTNFTSYGNVSLAGTKSSQAMFTYSDNQATEVFSKTASHIPNISTLRSDSNFNSIFDWVNHVVLEESADVSLSWRVYDLAGRCVISESGSSTHLVHDLQNMKNVLTDGIYIIKSMALNSKYEFAGKLSLH